MVGIYQSKERVIFLRVQNRFEEILRSVFAKLIDLVSVLWTESWCGYKNIL